MSNYAVPSINIHRIKHGEKPLDTAAISTLAKPEKVERKRIRKVATKDTGYRGARGDRKKNRALSKVISLSNQVNQLKGVLKREREKKWSFVATDPFWISAEWRSVRYWALKRCGRRCLLCGSVNKVLHVDHIKPRSLHPTLALDINNLQVLCEDCNIGKSNKDDTDFR